MTVGGHQNSKKKEAPQKCFKKLTVEFYFICNTAYVYTSRFSIFTDQMYVALQQFLEKGDLFFIKSFNIDPFVFRQLTSCRVKTFFRRSLEINYNLFVPLSSIIWEWTISVSSGRVMYGYIMTYSSFSLNI